MSFFSQGTYKFSDLSNKTLAIPHNKHVNIFKFADLGMHVLMMKQNHDFHAKLHCLPFKAVTLYQYGTNQAWNFYIFAVSNSHRT